MVVRGRQYPRRSAPGKTPRRAGLRRIAARRAGRPPSAAGAPRLHRDAVGTARLHRVGRPVPRMPPDRAA